ncbi:hypothetical protein [Ulvibacter litoralis]|uniref:Uncharacterized protein n=1 Tax=Ulvibacter litoralis TaxID=227084 RepID=A0A1G7FBQ6_9FLAO|nr:hypothetical protein [Ulvibacter litoralis]GHC51857.1 hypothetical protein GCM10008083_14440 [Ulvibacter litoralis]SDE73302.1 hypothetical protein SAMN05421855_102459 [Ulvibacter litoralis]
MDKPNNKSTKHLSHYKTDRKSLVIGGIIVLLIALSPILFYSYRSFPESQTLETSFFTLNTSFPSFYAYAWYFTGKFIPLYLLLLWFLTCKHWWHWIILVPIAMYSFQLWGVINESNSLDELELVYIFPLMMILVPAVYLIRAKIFNQVRENDFQSFEEELAKKKSVWGQIKDLFQ